ncbi:MAG: DUF2617 family protein [Planctomycetaceae bacterium]
MSVKFARPSIADLTFQVFGRSVHPELFDVYAVREFWNDAYSVGVRICEAGHVVAFRLDELTVTEVVSTHDQPLPRRCRSFCQKLGGSRNRSARFGGLNYEVSFHVERLDAEVFQNFHQELLVDAERVELAHRFPAGNRFSPEPLSLLRADAQPDSLLVHAYHTFPEHCAVVKSQSLFEFA